MPRKIRQLIADLEKEGSFRRRAAKVPTESFGIPSARVADSKRARGRRRTSLSGKQVRSAIRQATKLKPEDRYLKFVRWEEEDRLYVGYCPDLFFWGGVCHAETEDEAFRQLRALVQEEVEDLQQSGKELPPVSTRPMREAVPA